MGEVSRIVVNRQIDSPNRPTDLVSIAIRYFMEDAAEKEVMEFLGWGYHQYGSKVAYEVAHPRP